MFSARHERIQIKIETDMRAKIKQTRQTPTSLAHLRPCRHLDLLTNLPVNHKSPSNASCVIGYQKGNQLRLNCFAWFYVKLVTDSGAPWEISFSFDHFFQLCELDVLGPNFCNTSLFISAGG